MNEWLTLAALIIGPVSAVGITLWIEGERRKRDSRLTVLRQLMVTRHLPSDPNYSAAVNLIPVEFNAEKEVMLAYKAYQEAVAQVPGSEENAIAQFTKNVGVKQTKMIFAIMQAMKLRASEADLPVEAYAARGFITRDNLWLDSLRATIRIANALEAQTQYLGATTSASAPVPDVKGQAK